jgi:hypothetical protein
MRQVCGDGHVQDLIASMVDRHDAWLGSSGEAGNGVC